MKLTFISAPEQFKGIKSRLYIYSDEAGNKYIYKELTPPFEEKIKNELAAHKLAKLAGVNVLNFIKRDKLPNRNPGLLMNFLETASTLADFKRELSSKQKQDLRKIILFDIWIGNSDRHTANILITDRLIAFDHTKLFKQSEKATDFIKLAVGRKLDKDYVSKLEKLMRLKLSTKDVLIKWFGFNEADFSRIKNIKEQEIRKIVSESKLTYLIKRKNNLLNFSFI